MKLHKEDSEENQKKAQEKFEKIKEIAAKDREKT